MIDQRNQLKQVFQRKIYSKTAAKVEKKVTTFGENIHLEKFQPYEKVFGCAGMILPTQSQPRLHYCLTDGAAVDQAVFLL